MDKIKNIEILKDLEDKALLKQLVFAGIIAPKVYTYMQIYYHVDVQIRKKVKKKQAVCNTAAVFNVSPRTVYSAINCVK